MADNNVFVLFEEIKTALRGINNYCCPLNLKSAQFIIPESSEIGLRDFLSQK